MLTRFLFLAVLAAAQTAPGPGPVFFSASLPLEGMRGKQAVVATTLGEFVIQLLPEAAPNHVGLFMKSAQDGTYSGTIFHNVVRDAVVQGGDPVTRDSARAADYGQGGFDRLRAESTAERHTAGAVSTVRAPGRPDSGGTQFFICVSDQPTLDGQYTVFGRVVDGLEIVRQISAVPKGGDGRPLTRVEIKSVTIRDTPLEPFVNDTVVELQNYLAVVETTMGNMVLEFLPDKAPETVRSFLRRASAGLYDGTAIHRVSPNFVIQTGALGFRLTPLTARQQKLIYDLAPEFNDTVHVPGIVSMARGEDPGSASTSFFICTGACRSLDGKYTAFARVVGGLDVMNKIASVPVNGEDPVSPLFVTKISIERR